MQDELVASELYTKASDELNKSVQKDLDNNGEAAKAKAQAILKELEENYVSNS